ncbi:hypothetical protein [Halioxenophilus aromaticivorans]|uniref:Uncharacterized protein n=1 Tax=Halioxenophilus aromaticivorans TaxID=1306992 RepID=A0AAV3U2Z4_9ALTE
MGQVIDLGEARERAQSKHARISESLKRLARENRQALLSSYPYVRFWLQDVQREHYVHLLRLHLALREAIENNLEYLGDHFEVEALFDQQRKQFSIAHFVKPNIYKSDLIRKDLAALNESPFTELDHSPKLKEFLGYIRRTSNAYSVSLLGTLFVLEDNLASAGNQLATTLVQNNAVNNFALNYLSSYADSKDGLWQFTQSLDSISDFQTQANVVIAATLSYEMHRDLLKPMDVRRWSAKRQADLSLDQY